MLKKLWKIFVSFLAVIGGLHLILFLIFWSIFGNLIQTVCSIEQVKGTNLYLMEYHGDYGFDHFLEVGASTSDELVSFVREELTLDLPIEIDLSDYGCTTFVAETASGQTLMGRNFDMVDCPAMLVRTNPRNGYKSISMVSLFFLGFDMEHPPESLMDKLMTFGAVYTPMDGVNEKGLAVSVMLLNEKPINQQTDKVDITTSTAIRLMLDKAATVQEAVELLGQYDMHSTSKSAYHFMIADAKGNSAVVEYVNNEMKVLWDQKVSTNFRLSSQNFSTGLGMDRYRTATAVLEKTEGFLSRKEAMKLLEACRWNEAALPESSTQWSCVYNLDRRSVDLVLDEDWDNVRRYRLSWFPFF